MNTKLDGSAKSPILTKLERVVYNRCLVTGDTVEEALHHDMELWGLIADHVKDDIRLPEISRKLDGQAGWWKQQAQKREVGVRRPQDEPGPARTPLSPSAACDGSDVPAVIRTGDRASWGSGSGPKDDPDHEPEDRTDHSRPVDA